MRLDDRGDNRQAQPVAGPVGPGFVAAHELLEQVRQELRVDVGSVVGDRQLRVGGAAAGGVAADVGGLGMDFFGVGLDYTGMSTLSEGAGGVGSLAGLGGAGASASMGQAASLGGVLSVPRVWAEAVEAAPITPANAMALPAANLGSAAPAISTAVPSAPKLPLVSLAGREASTLVQQIGLRSRVIPQSPIAG